MNLSVNRKMQLLMISRISGILFVCLLMSGAVYYYFANQEITASFTMFHIKARNFLDFLMPAVIGSFGVSLVVGVVASLFFPKNIAGALYGVERDMRKVIEGDYTVRIFPRKGDQVGSLVALLNQLIAGCREKTLSIEEAVSKAHGLCAAESTMTDEERLVEIQQIQTQLLHEISKLKVR